MRVVRRSTPVLIAAAALAAVTAAPPSAQAATCVNKAAEGTNTTRDGALFQAWEAVLQATDWGSWSQFMAGSNKIGVAPGYQVSNVRQSCTTGGLGHVCRMQATLCK